MRKGFVFAVCLASCAAVACGSSLTSAPDATVDGPEHDGRILVEAQVPDSGRDARTGMDAKTSDGKPEEGGTDGHVRDGTVEGSATDGEAGTLDGPPDSDAASDAAFDAVADSPIDAMDDVVPPGDGSTCLTESPNYSAGLFVVTGGSTSYSCGSVVTPCGSLEIAIAVASTTPSVTTIYVGPGTFSSSSTLAIPSGIAIVGGWNVVKSTWKHNCQPPLIEGPSPVFSATSLKSPATLDTLDVVETTVAGAGISLYGITSFDSTLNLTNVSLTVNAGGAGTNGSKAGAAGAAGATTGCKPAGDGGPGGAGDAGAPTSSGTFGPPPGGFVPAHDGTDGIAGASGRHGVIGGFGEVETNETCETTDPCSVISTNTVEGGTGRGGCGGGGGKGGTPGTGGGCSIGVYAWGGAVTISGGTLQTGNGGAGGDGANGGKGGKGGSGVDGTPITYTESCFYKAIPTPHCVDMPGTASGGDAGGPGGVGGTGGAGGGGAGGCSYGYYAGYGAIVTPTGVTFAPGSGGPGGKPNGATGPSGDHN